MGHPKLFKIRTVDRQNCTLLSRSRINESRRSQVFSSTTNLQSTSGEDLPQCWSIASRISRGDSVGPVDSDLKNQQRSTGHTTSDRRDTEFSSQKIADHSVRCASSTARPVLTNTRGYRGSGSYHLTVPNGSCRELTPFQGGAVTERTATIASAFCEQARPAPVRCA